MSKFQEQSTNSAARKAAPAHVLERLAESCGARHDPATLGRRLEQSDPPGADARSVAERLEWLARVAHELGLRTSLSRARPEQAVAVLRSGLPLVTVRADGSRWHYLTIGRGRGIRVTSYGEGLDPEGESREVRLTPARIARALEADENDELEWLVAEPATPQQRAVSSSSDGVPLRPLQRLVRLLRPERRDVLAVVAYSVAIGILMLATPIAVQALVNSIALGGLLQPLVVVALLLLLALGFAAALTAVQTWVVELIQRRVFVRTVADLAARLPRVQIEAYDRVDGPELVNRFFDVITVQKVTAKLLIDALSVVLAVLVGLTVLAFYHPLLLAFDILLLFIIAALVLAPLRRGQRTAIAESSAKYAVAGWLEEIARNPYAFKTGGAQQWIFERSDALASAWVGNRTAHFRTLFAQVVGALGLQVLASTTLLGIGGWLVIQGSLTLGQLVAAELIVTAVVASVAKMGKYLESWYDLMAAVYKVGRILDLPVESQGGEQQSADGAPEGSALELRELGWSDPRGRTVLDDVSLQVAPGARVGIAGPSGAGKTKLVELLWRLREPASGSIALDGRDIRDLSPELLRREVAVAGPIELVQGTVRQNVKLQRPFVSNDDVREAVDRAGLRAEIAALPQGLDTVVRPSGHLQSQSELKRLMLARAIAGAPRLLVVDDLFDGLPPATRAPIFDMLFDPAAAWTLVVVSNLPEVLERCDRVLHLTPPEDASGEPLEPAGAGRS